MGQVFKAEQRPIRRDVALKLLHPKYIADEEVQERFLLEAQTASQLRHPNTITVYDFGNTNDDLYYIAMEYVEGEPLASLIHSEGPLPLARVGPIVIQIAQSLGEAHRKGIIHRDLKPDNVMVSKTRDGNDRAKVLDFGIAKLTNQNVGLTQTGSVFGTPGYMSPEQARGDEVDPSSDFYALTCVLYEALTGELPYKGGSALETMMKHQSDDIPSLGPGFPPELDDFLRQGLAKSPGNRLSSADDFIAAFLGCFVDNPAVSDSLSQELASQSGNFDREQFDSGPNRSAETPETRSTQPEALDSGEPKDVPSNADGSPTDSQQTREADSLPSAAASDSEFATQTTATQRRTSVPSDRQRSTPDGEAIGSAAESTTSSTTSSNQESHDEERSGPTAHPKAESKNYSPTTTDRHQQNAGSSVMTILGIVGLVGVSLAVGSLLSGGEPSEEGTAAETAQLEIASEPSGATVSVDGRRMGATPLQANVPTDEPFDVTLSQEGFEAKTYDDIQYDNQSNDRLFAELSPKILKVRVSAPVDGTEVVINDISFGKLPANRTRSFDVSWPTDALRIRLNPPGYEPYLDNIPAETVESPVEVTPKKADLVRATDAE